ncbi:acetyl-CoA synthetase-like protein [Penicillium verhagenii]|uniref:acetyl-CoA synthetase-like protein n=1 Tax=Penicillium verhagenii TaxID=1562060 RepID=UPI00254598DF|nr:acetyl-CoA synthetase-like protein [Penicillium verhagenii]KAJ5919116.1 acetyl-CoA synthetase-like protein [Penicillium verhagenii]
MATPAVEVFANDALITNLVKLRDTFPGAVVYDEYGIEADYEALLDDVMHLRQVLRTKLSPDSLDSRGLLRPGSKHIATMTVSVYYFIVSFIAIASLGGASVPLSPTGSLNDTAFSVSKVYACCILFDPWTVEQFLLVKDHFETTPDKRINTIQMERAERSSISPHIEVDESLTISESDTCLIMFSSGTTGKPKGIALPRKAFFINLKMNPTAVFMTYRPVHWMGSAASPLANVMRGVRVRALKRGADPGRIWDVLKEGTITMTSLTPVRLKAMKDFYHSTISHLPSEEHDKYISGASKLQSVFSSGSVLNPSTVQFWKNLTNMPISSVFGMTELGCGKFGTSPGSPFVEQCIGEPIPGLLVKLSDGDTGQLLVKYPGMFTHYIGDEEATKAAFDEEGYFKTGDVVRRDGKQYIFLGRGSSDLSVLEMEQRLLNLPYVTEAHVLPIMDYEARELVAALIRLEPGHDGINLEKIRADLSPTTESYKLPRVLRILQEGEITPVTGSEKSGKAQIREKYFKVAGYRPSDYAVPGVEFYGNETGHYFAQGSKTGEPSRTA